jgi:hypothetical protein
VRGNTPGASSTGVFGQGDFRGRRERSG